ncbi:GD18695 [Drosophila simulans]|uniref:GD18695 n=1 Tax=Drosophila simulans TaxID=7240 RepID=B4NVL5_DROSI|nr:GD18695 [Drosophila simulans]
MPGSNMSLSLGVRGRGALWLALLLATTAFCGAAWAAPTVGGAASAPVVGQKQSHHHYHHLEIGVQGNTPTLMEASTTRDGKHATVAITQAPPKPSTTATSTTTTSTTEMARATDKPEVAEEVPSAETKASAITSTTESSTL